MHPSAYADAGAFVRQHLDRGRQTDILDVGAFDVNGCLRPLFDSPAWCYVGVDMQPGPNVDVVLPDPYAWPIFDDSFDVVVSTQTLEHVPKPWRWLPELARVVKPGGLVYVCTPNTIHYHPYPVDCWRAWPDGLKALAEDAGLAVLRCYAAGMDTTLIATKGA